MSAQESQVQEPGAGNRGGRKPSRRSPGRSSVTRREAKGARTLTGRVVSDKMHKTIRWRSSGW